MPKETLDHLYKAFVCSKPMKLSKMASGTLPDSRPPRRSAPRDDSRGDSRGPREGHRGQRDNNRGPRRD